MGLSAAPFARPASPDAACLLSVVGRSQWIMGDTFLKACVRLTVATIVIGRRSHASYGRRTTLCLTWSKAALDAPGLWQCGAYSCLLLSRGCGTPHSAAYTTPARPFWDPFSILVLVVTVVAAFTLVAVLGLYFRSRYVRGSRAAWRA